MDFSGIILFLQILSGIICAALIYGIIRSWLGNQEISETRKKKLFEHFQTGPIKEKKSNPQIEKWLRIVDMFKARDPIIWRMAIIDADTLLEDMITGMGYTEPSFGDKLKQMQGDNIPWLQAAWEVHLLRNKLAHEGSHYPLTEREAYRAFKIYENLLFGTGYLA